MADGAADADDKPIRTRLLTDTCSSPARPPSDGWSDRFDVVERQEETALGGLSIRISSAYVYDFDDYYFALNPFTNQRNPWFAEFWETRFQCNLELPLPPSDSSSSPAQRPSQRAFVRPAGAKAYNRTCTGRESLRQNHKQDAKMAFVQKSIITMALGLDSMQRALCSRPGVCDQMLPINGPILLQHLMNVSFSFLDERVTFDRQGDPPGRYEILNFRRRSAGASWSRMPPAPPHLATSDYSAVSADGATATTIQRPPNYDSYSTLKVHRPAGTQLAADFRRRRRRKSVTPRRLEAPREQVQANQVAGYSPTSHYEYVQVGSWQSSDGLNLFGEIHWPARSVSLAPGSEPSAAPHWSMANELGTEQQLGGSTSGSGPISAPPKSVCSPPCAKGHAKVSFRKAPVSSCCAQSIAGAG